ncbi:hypothetical protein [Rhizobium sp. AN73]|uniref:hypothetical protein n=1 Tax=Rhizobium sp. AN73 TaxID=3035124 RepID=UPI0027419E54|nr:hypothetical protein [Rhizobium sp. AN73]
MPAAGGVKFGLAVADEINTHGLSCKVCVEDQGNKECAVAGQAWCRRILPDYVKKQKTDLPFFSVRLKGTHTEAAK